MKQGGWEEKEWKEENHPNTLQSILPGEKKGGSTRTLVQPESWCSLRQKENLVNEARPRRLSAQACLEKVMFINQRIKPAQNWQPCHAMQ